MHLNSQGYQIGLRMPLAYFVKKLGVRSNEAFLGVTTLFPPVHPRKHTAQEGTKNKKTTKRRGKNYSRLSFTTAIEHVRMT